MSLVFVGITIIISLSIHEFAHARIADRLGDSTPRLQGRLTPNPLAHIDIIGFIMIFLIGFGWGKPVITNPHNFRDPIKGDFLVAMAGPLSNLILVLIGGIIVMIYTHFISGTLPQQTNSDLVVQFRMVFCFINSALAIFNLLPIFPLDGYRIIKIILPRVGYFMEKNAIIFQILFLVILFGPGSNIIGSIVSGASRSVVFFIFSLLSQFT